MCDQGSLHGFFDGGYRLFLVLSFLGNFKPEMEIPIGFVEFVFCYFVVIYSFGIVICCFCKEKKDEFIVSCGIDDEVVAIFPLGGP